MASVFRKVDCISLPVDDLDKALGFRAPMLVQLLDRALATNPSERVQTAAELAAGFEAQVRVLGPQLGAPPLGPWLKALFADEPDPLAQFAPLGAAPMADAATEHGYRPASPIPGAPTELEQPMDPAPSSGKGGAPPPPSLSHGGGQPATEVLERPVAPLGSLEEATGRVLTDRAPAPVQAFRATIAGGDTEPPDPGPAPRARTVVEAELVDPSPTVQPARDDTQVVRQRIRPVEDSASVGEALSMLAYLQQQRARPEPAPTVPSMPPAPAPKAAPRAAPADDEPLPELRPQRGAKVGLLLLGVLIGVGATLGTQAILRQSAAEPAAAAAPAPGLVAADPTPPPAAAEAPEPVADAPAAPEPEPQVPAPPPPALLDVTYPKGARVWLDGDLIGRVPLTGIEVSPGEHELRVRRRRYRRRVRFEAEPGAQLEMKKKLEVR